MADPWRTVKIFISSTFRDMHAERDWLVKRVFPALREKLEPHRVHLIDIDLRWGITEEQAHKDQVLDVCLDTIEECRPFFLGLLGERYGWVPSANKLPEESSRHGWTQEHTGKSVTELEIRWGVLLKPGMREQALFCSRDSAFSRDVPPGKRADVEAEDAGSAEKLARLKQEILAAHLPLSPILNYPCHYAGLRLNRRLLKLDAELADADRTRLDLLAADGLIDNAEYAQLPTHLQEVVNRLGVVYLRGLESFGQQVQDRLWTAIQTKLQLSMGSPGTAPIDVFEQEEGFHVRFMETRRRVYRGRQQLLNDLIQFAEGPEECPCLVTAPSGAGKSAALARFAGGIL